MQTIGIPEGIKVILLGEVHGVKENVEIVKTFIKALEETGKSVILALEWPSNLNEDIKKFFAGSLDELPWREWDFVRDKDGRISKEHVELLGWLKDRNQKISPEKSHDVVCFSEMHTDWNMRDRKMAQNIISIQEGSRKGKIILAVMGNLHADRKPNKMPGEKYISLASHLEGGSFLNYKIFYCAGTFLNYRKKRFASRSCPSDRIVIQLSEEQGFDYDIFVPCAHPIALLEKQNESK